MNFKLNFRLKYKESGHGSMRVEIEINCQRVETHRADRGKVKIVQRNSIMQNQ